MFGLFDKMFDFNNDGKLDSLERALEAQLIYELSRDDDWGDELQADDTADYDDLDDFDNWEDDE